MTRPANPELPKRILEAAEEMVAAEGHDALNMRALAEQVGVTPTALYYYFSSKEHILLRLKLRAARMLNENIVGIDATQPPDDAIRALGEAYIGFAEENPHLYKLLMEQLLPGQVVSEDDRSAMKSGYHAAHRLLQDLAERYICRHDPELLAMVGWIMLHGFCSLLIAGTLESVEGPGRDKLKTVFLDYFSSGVAEPKTPPEGGSQ